MKEAKPDPETQEEWLAYRKGVKFILGKLHREAEAKDEYIKKLEKYVSEVKQAFKK